MLNNKLHLFNTKGTENIYRRCTQYNYSTNYYGVRSEARQALSAAIHHNN